MRAVRPQPTDPPPPSFPSLRACLNARGPRRVSRDDDGFAYAITQTRRGTQEQADWVFKHPKHRGYATWWVQYKALGKQVPTPATAVRLTLRLRKSEEATASSASMLVTAMVPTNPREICAEKGWMQLLVLHNL